MMKGEALQATQASVVEGREEQPCCQVPGKEHSCSLWSGTMMGPAHCLRVHGPGKGGGVGGNGEVCSLSRKMEH